MKNEDYLNVMFFHGKTIDGYRFTIAGNTDGYKLHMGISICSEKDLFRKASRRSIATTRLLSERNRHNVGKIENEIIDSFENELSIHKYFTKEAANFNHMRKKLLLKTFNLYRHKLPFKLKLSF